MLIVEESMRAEVVARTAFARDWEALAHTARVVKELQKIILIDSRKDDAIATAWLHDVVEDTGVGYADLQDMRFHPHVIGAVRLLTRDGSTDYYGYKDRILKATGPEAWIAQRVKLADARENLKRCEAAFGVPKWERLGKSRYAPLVQELEVLLGLAPAYKDC